jgi:protoheme IX farnesyltransferase
MGSLATTGTVGLQEWAFFATLLFWQFPHFMAIAWLYRDQYREGGHKMLTVIDPTGRRAGKKAVVTCAILILVSLLPALTFRTDLQSVLFSFSAVLLGYFYMRDSIRFAGNRNKNTARRLLRTSIIYLPLFMLALVIASLS